MINENDIIFNIFGVPNGFDHYGSKDDIGKLQFYYDGSKEENKINILRRSNGDVTYAYLKYGVIAGDKRAGSFFGMSITFKNQYCSDIENLYKIFYSAYNKIIKEGKILEVLPNGIIKYKILSFKEVQENIKKLESVIKNSILKEFQKDIHPLDNSFLNDNLNKYVRLNSVKDNNIVINTLKKYGSVTFLPENEEINKVELQKKDSFSVAGNKVKSEKTNIGPKNINSLVYDFDRILKTAKFDSDGNTGIIISKDELDIILKSLRSNQIITNKITNNMEK